MLLAGVEPPPFVFGVALVAELAAFCESVPVDDGVPAAPLDAAEPLFPDVAALLVAPEAACELVASAAEGLDADVDVAAPTSCASASMSPTIALNAVGLRP